MTSSETDDVQSGGFKETVKVIIHALLLALIVRTFLYQPFNIPSSSMKSTLLIGDYLFVSKFSYGYSHFSLPWSPKIFSGRIFSEEPERGDVAVFRLPSDPDIDYIKRVIGLPGDKIQMIDGQLHINGTAVPRERIEDFQLNNRGGRVVAVKRYRETLPNGVSYTTLDLVENGFSDNTQVYEVPEGHYFMMGDNRDNSSDSRVVSGVGYVPLENFIGRAEIIFFSVDEDSSAWRVWEWPTSLRWGRILEAGDKRVTTESAIDLSAFSARIGYQFKNGEFAWLALSHRSIVNDDTKARTNERLEFLGDRVLGLVTANMLYRVFPDADEGELHRRHRALIRKDTCADIAREIGLGAFLLLGKSEIRSGGRTKQAILADALEALIAAIYLDGGLQKAEAFIERHWRRRVEDADKPHRDGKSALQEWVQGRGFPPPVYEETDRSGPDHQPEFTVRVVISGLEPAFGKGFTKREAEQAAAEAFLVAGGLWDQGAGQNE